MYEILIKSDFSSAHNLRGYRGRCERLHGHNWKVDARFETAALNNIGISVDFKVLKSKLKSILKRLDHTYLNRISAFKRKNPSAENIAKYIFKELKSSLKSKDFFVKSVSVWESDASCATYYD
ncbi:6-carboxytetrahydropterin synthase QueD [Candidatus Omnitrophota bacterium]